MEQDKTGTWAGIGATLLGIGVAALLVLLVANSQDSTEPYVSDELWFRVSFGGSVIIALVGLYVLVALFAPLPLPSFRDFNAPRERRNVGDYLPRLKIVPPKKRLRDLFGSKPFRVVKATYGESGQGKDVTDLLNSMIENNKLRFYLDNKTMGGDPTPNVQKLLLVTWRVGRKESSSSFAEGRTVTLPD